MGVRLLRANERAAAPWKNGAGVTREIAAFPPGADLGTFHWRVSMATVSAGGPFSLFPGVDRILSVLEGELVLDMEDRRTVRLDPGSDPFAFPGDVPVSAQAPPCPVVDLNVMTRRGWARARVTKWDAVAQIAGSGPTTLILALAPESRVRLDGADHSLARYDAMLVEGDAGAPIALASDHPEGFLLIEIEGV